MEKFTSQFAVLQEVADASVEGVVMYSVDDEKLFYSNSSAFDLLGLRKDATRREIESILAAVVPEDREYVKKQYADITRKAVTTDVEFRVTGSQGNDVFLCCNAYLVAEESAIIIYIQDITRARQREDYLVEFGARKDTVLDTLIHHMSGALNLMRHLSSEAEKYVETTNDEQLTVFLRLLNDNNTHCLKIIEDLVRVEHEESPFVSVVRSKFDIIEKISIVHSELLQSFKGRQFRFEHSADSLFINSDDVKLLQVVSNLVSNAIKFSPPEAPIEIRISQKGQDVVCSVTDHGIGIPEDMQSLIFERLPGLGRTGLNGEKSIGFGLFICKHLVNLLRGKIWFESEEGRGSTFFFSVPIV